MKKLKFLVLICSLLFCITGYSNKANSSALGVTIDYLYILHNDGCFYLYRIETYVFDTGSVVYSIPLTPLNYIGNTSICSMVDTIDDYC